ncbi:TolC family protein [bacterium]|nr:TolC family protein [bacterium]
MKKILTVLIVLIINFNSVSAKTQEASVQKVDLSFEQAYELMLENNNSLKAYNELINKQKYEKRAALGEFSPKVVMNATYLHFSENWTLNSSGNVMNIPFSATTLIQDRNLFTMGGTAVWNVFTGGKLLSNHAAARAKLEAADHKYREIKDNLTVELVKRYYGLRLARDVVEVRKQVSDGMDKHLRDAKLLEREGMISKSERLHAEVAASDAKRDYKAALRDANIAQEGLKALIKSENANLKDIYVEPKSMLFIYKKSDVDLDQMKENAIANNPQLMQLRAKKKALNAKYHAQMANYSPTVSLVAYDIFATDNLSQAVPHAAFGVTANWLLFDGLSRYNNVRAADSERKMADYEIADAQFNIESLVIKQYEDLMKYKEKYDSSDKNVENAKEALRTADLAFREGLGTSLQVTDAQMMLSKVNIDRLKAIYDYDVTLVDLLKTNGDAKEILHFIVSSSTETLEDK